MQTHYSLLSNIVSNLFLCSFRLLGVGSTPENHKYETLHEFSYPKDRLSHLYHTELALVLKVWKTLIENSVTIFGFCCTTMPTVRWYRQSGSPTGHVRWEALIIPHKKVHKYDSPRLLLDLTMEQKDFCLFPS